MGIAYNTSIVRDGLVLHLDAANTKSYPGTGTLWNDLSGNGNHGTLVNGPTYTNSNNGSIVFDGVNDYVTVDYPTLALNIPSMTVEMWFKTTTTTVVSMFGSYNNLSPNPIILSINLNRGFGTRDTTSVGYTGVYIRDTAGRYLTGYVNSPIYDGNWHCFLWRIINSATNDHEVFVDGDKQVLINTDATGPASFANFEFPVGINSFHGRGIFNPSPAGVHSSTKIYNRALSETEIKQNFEALRGRYAV